jgi:hypothetical protein
MVCASGNAPELGTDLVRPAYKAAVLFELRARNKFKMQNADFKLLRVHCENPS